MIFALQSKGFVVKRYQMASDPNAFLNNEAVMRLVREHQMSALPVIVINGEVIKSGITQPWLRSKLHLTKGHNEHTIFVLFRQRRCWKTSMACVTAVRLADEGKRTLIVTTDPASNLADVFEQKIGHEVTPITGVKNLWAMEIDPDIATANTLTKPWRPSAQRSRPRSFR